MLPDSSTVSRCNVVPADADLQTPTAAIAAAAAAAATAGAAAAAATGDCGIASNNFTATVVKVVPWKDEVQDHPEYY